MWITPCSTRPITQGKSFILMKLQCIRNHSFKPTRTYLAYMHAATHQITVHSPLSNPSFVSCREVAEFAPEEREKLIEFKVINSKFWCRLRPGLREFLAIISQYYELTIYTNGTMDYALQVRRRRRSRSSGFDLGLC